MIKNYSESEDFYYAYIGEHQLNVKLVWEKLKRTCRLPSDTYENLKNCISGHDSSKYCAEEFEAYRNKFFPFDGEIKYANALQKAWNHHQKTNPHHWQYWIMWKPEGSFALDMDIEYLLEMIIDWTAMSYKFKQKDVSSWYEKEKNNMLLSEVTRAEVEKWLPIFDKILSELSYT